jgi:adenine/guanine phosphoribosyltransferase-like PRPP-binding protein
MAAQAALDPGSPAAGGGSVERCVTLAEAEAYSAALARLIARGPVPDVIVGLANGALLPTFVASEELGVPYVMLKIRRRGSRYKQRLGALADALHIPKAMLAWGPLLHFWRRLLERFSDLESPGDETLDLADKSVVVVDDCIWTGASILYVLELLRRAGARQVVVAVISWVENDRPVSREFAPDLYINRAFECYPWAGNSPYQEEFRAWLTQRGLQLWT